jgi:hypothetical protein
VGSVVAPALPAEDRSACVIEFGVRNLPIALILAGGASPSVEIVAFLLCYFFVSTTALLTLALLNRSVRHRLFA